MIKQILFVLFLLSNTCINSQNPIVKGRVIDSFSEEAIEGVELQIVSSGGYTKTSRDGKFNFMETILPLGEQILKIRKEGYLPLKIPIIIMKGETIDLDPILLELDQLLLRSKLGVILLDDDQLEDKGGIYQNISGLLQSSPDVFLKAVAYDFSSTFFRPRGLDNSTSKILINGIELNKIYDGRPQWGNWGGLNDVQRNRNFTYGIKANEHHFGGISGTTNITMLASQYKKGGKFSYAVSNRTYQGRIMASYNSGIGKNGWSYSASISRRFGDEGFKEGTFYNANSFFGTIEKKINRKHSLNLAAIYTPSRRGRSSAITKEVFNLKGRTYNPYWGYHKGIKRNSRVKEIKEPIFMINHFFILSDNTTINTNIAYQKGTIGTTRIDYGNNRNPYGNYYQRMPSYFLRNNDQSPYNYQQAYLAEQEFLDDGQLDWESLYSGNINSFNKLSSYVIQEDIIDDTQFTVNSILLSELSENIVLNASINFKSFKSKRYALLDDLLGGLGYLDVDYFSISDYGISGDKSQSDLQNPGRVVREGDRYKYNYHLAANTLSVLLQSQFSYRKLDFYFGINIETNKYQRFGIYENGHFPGERSLGRSEKVKFTTYGIKSGFNYKFNGRHFVETNIGYISNAPNLKNTFPNARQNNDVVFEISNETHQVIDLSYHFRTPKIKAKLAAYYITAKDKTDVGFYFTQNALGVENNSAFVQEVVTGISERNIGSEFGLEAYLLPTFKFKAAASFSQYVYNTNPKLYLSGDDFLNGDDILERGIRDVNLLNNHVPSGPEKAFQLGFEYRSSEYWFIGFTTNYFADSYIDISFLRRTSDFYTDNDGLPFNDYQEELAKKLLKQESFGDYYLVNIVGGKSWKVDECIIGFFASINNILDQEFIIGGYENSRKSSYRQLIDEQNRDNGPLFGNNYFFGNGTTYYLNTYIRF